MPHPKSGVKLLDYPSQNLYAKNSVKKILQSSKGYIEPLTLGVLGLILISLTIGTVSVLRNNFDIRERAQTYAQRYSCVSGTCRQDNSGSYENLNACSFACRPAASPTPYCSGSGNYTCQGNISKYCVNPNIPTSDQTCASGYTCVADSRRCVVSETLCTTSGTYSCSGNTSRFCPTAGVAPSQITCESGQNCVSDSRRCVTNPNYCGTTLGYFCDGATSKYCASANSQANLQTCTGEQTCVTDGRRCVSNQTACQNKVGFSCEGQNSIYCSSPTSIPDSQTCTSNQQCVTNTTRCTSLPRCPTECRNGCFATDNNQDNTLDCRAYCKFPEGCFYEDSTGGRSKNNPLQEFEGCSTTSNVPCASGLTCINFACRAQGVACPSECNVAGGCIAGTSLCKPYASF